jgi:hypothetical protein
MLSTMDMKKKTQHFMIDKQKIEQSFEDIQTLFNRLTTVINYWNDENYLRAVDWLQNLDTVRYDLFQNSSHISMGFTAQTASTIMHRNHYSHHSYHQHHHHHSHPNLHTHHQYHHYCNNSISVVPFYFF